jgi:hypothetical protein
VVTQQKKRRDHDLVDFTLLGALFRFYFLAIYGGRTPIGRSFSTAAIPPTAAYRRSEEAPLGSCSFCRCAS